MKLDPADYGKPRDVHFNRANAALEQALRSDSYFATELDKLSPGVLQRVSAQGGRENPLNFVWHHHSENGVMRLVPKIQHTPGSIFWGTLHQDGRGGYSIWAIPNGAPPNRRG